MTKDFSKLLQGYKKFRDKYVHGSRSVMKQLADDGQRPEIMVVACCDSRVDPALILQCEPGDLFVVRNVANIVPPYEKAAGYHGISAALEFGINMLKVKHLVILGHSQCGGIAALIQGEELHTDFLHRWLLLIGKLPQDVRDTNHAAKLALQQSYEHCLEFPWIKQKVDAGELKIHLWFFDIFKGKMYVYDRNSDTYSFL